MTIELPYHPTEKQALFHASNADEVLYGGAAGGGKSKAIVMEALLDALEHPGVQSYLFRRSFPELEDTLIREALASIPPALGEYRAAKHDYLLKNGSVLHFRSCRSIREATKYQGAEIHRLYIDELTHFSQDIYDYLKTRLRAPKQLGVRPRVRCATNPGGTGHGWVKARFIDSAEPYAVRSLAVRSTITGAAETVTVQYIPATATDNPHLGADYLIQLEQKPEALRKALLLGDWNVFEGQVFTEFVSTVRADRQYTHVIPPFRIPKEWKRYRSFDWGYTRPFSVGYWAADRDGRLYRYAELYGSPKDPATGITARPNEGMQLPPLAVAKLIRDYEQRYEKGQQITGIADPAIFDESRGSEGSIAKVMEREGIYFERGDHKRLAGKLQLHNRLAFDENGIPMLYVFSSCKDFIRTLPAIVYDPFDVEDVDTRCEDHIYDETRYLCMLLPISRPRLNGAQDRDDPLNQFVLEKAAAPYAYLL